MVADGMNLRARLAEVLGFILRPTFAPASMSLGRGAAIALAAVAAIHAVLAAGAFGLLWLAQRSGGVLPAPDVPTDSLAASPLAFVVIAPVLEELVFRSWLTGRRSALRFAVYGFAAMGLMLAGVTLFETYAGPLALAGVAAAFAGLVHWGLTRGRDDSVPGWFVRHFAAVVWGVSLVFGLVHLGNYAALTNPLGVLVVLPQTLGGVLLAYVRTRLGLVTAIAYHAAYNGLFFALAGG